jgi:uncharacterized protein YjbI with pentapeptide repeats
LNYIGISFSNLDFENIRVPKANLSRAIMFNTNLYKANLQEVSFVNSIISRANMSQSELKDADFGLYPHI